MQLPVATRQNFTSRVYRLRDFGAPLYANVLPSAPSTLYAVNQWVNGVVNQVSSSTAQAYSLGSTPVLSWSRALPHQRGQNWRVIRSPVSPFDVFFLSVRARTPSLRESLTLHSM